MDDLDLQRVVLTVAQELEDQALLQVLAPTPGDRGLAPPPALPDSSWPTPLPRLARISSAVESRYPENRGC